MNLFLTHVQNASHGAEKAAFNVSEMIVHHLKDGILFTSVFGIDLTNIYGMNLSITKRVVMMWLAAIILFAVFIPVARKIAKNPYRKPGRFQGLMEVFIQFIRNDVGKGSMGHHSHGYEPFLLTMFFFILISNLLGLIPPLGDFAAFIGSTIGMMHPHHGHDSLSLPLITKLWPGITATGDVAVTASLAVFSFLVIQTAGFVHQGVLYIRNIVPNGIPMFLFPLMWIIELVGQFTKPFALAIRLLANMTAGHIVILVLMGFIFQFESYGVVPVSVIGASAIFLLELFVAFLQAYIFVFLTALFIAGSQHRH